MKNIMVISAACFLVAGCTDPAKRFVVDLGPRYECSKGERRIDPAIAAAFEFVGGKLFMVDPEGEKRTPLPDVPDSVLKFLKECKDFLESKPDSG